MPAGSSRLCKMHKNFKRFINIFTKLCRLIKNALTNPHFVVQYKVADIILPDFFPSIRRYSGKELSMSKIIAITSGKGGTGKSTICAELGFALAKQGHRTLIIELDFGLRCLDIMLGVKDDIKYDLGSVLNGECDIYKATTQVKLANNLSIVCAPEDPFAKVDAETISNICNEMRKYYEYIIVDTSAGTNESVFDVVEQSDLILINTTPDPICVRDARLMSDEFYKRGNKKQRLIINKVDPDIFKADIIPDLDSIIDTVGVQLIGVIPSDNDVVVSTGKGIPLPSNSLAFRAFDAISKRIKGEDVPLSFKILLQ